ncbi:MAG TPA: hypothetical protein DCZ63_14900 [Geobacter sp.]|nr:hypothetical protein [Geobacter sp.]
MPDGSLIDDDEFFVLTPDVLHRDVPEELALKRGDMPNPDSLDKRVELILDEDKERDEDDDTAAADEGDAADTGEAEGEGEADLGTTTDGGELEADEGKKKTPKDVPYGRLVEKHIEIQALKDEIAKLQAGQQQAAAVTPTLPTFDLQAKYKEYADLVADGETDGAAKIMQEIDEFKDLQAEIRFNAMAEARDSRRRAQTLVNQLVVEQKEFFADQTNLDVFEGAKNALLRKGYSLDQALAETAKRFFGEPKVVVEETDEAKAKADAEKAKLEQKKAEQKKTAVISGAKAASQQPSPVTSGVSARTTPTVKPNALTLTDAERKSMSEKEKRRARGDFV